MYFFLFITLIVYCNFVATNDVISNSLEMAENMDSVTYFCDDEVLKNMTQQVEALNVATQNSYILWENFNKELKDKLALHKDTLLKDIKKDIKQLLDDQYVNNSCQQSRLDNGKNLPTSCAEALHGNLKDGIYKLNLQQSGLKSFYVYCMKDPNNNGSAWTIVQRRKDGSLDFYRDWQEYKYGFGNLDGEFFLGLEQLHALTHSQLHELWIQMEDFENVRRFARYTSFIIGNERSKYVLNALGTYDGDAGDSMRWNQGCKFSTKDQDNDEYTNNCALSYKGAWWYNSCHHSNLNGLYLRGEYLEENYAKGVVWHSWHGYYYSLKYVHMAIRPVKH